MWLRCECCGHEGDDFIKAVDYSVLCPECREYDVTILELADGDSLSQLPEIEDHDDSC